MKITIESVAQKANVSKATVSRVLNGHFEYMSESTKQRVLKVIDEMGYSPNVSARSLKKKKTKIIGIIFSNVSNHFWTAVFESAEHYCKKMGYSVMVCSTQNDVEEEERYIRVLKSHQVDGIIVQSELKNESLYKQLEADNIPLSFIESHPQTIDTNIIMNDNFKGAKMAVEHLIKLGHKRIGIILYPLSPIRKSRFNGYKAALEENGITFDESLVYFHEEGRGKVQKNITNILKGSKELRPTAFFAINYISSLEAFAAIKYSELKFPEEVALVGYDDTEWAPLLEVPLTTVFQPSRELGELAAKALINKIEGEITSNSTILLHPKLVVRKSCGIDCVIRS